MTDQQDRTEVLPLVALRGMVLFPGITTRLAVGRKRSLAALDEARKRDNRMAFVAQKSPRVDEPEPDQLYDVGVIGTVQASQSEEQDGVVTVLVSGEERCRIVEHVSRDPYLAVRVRRFEPTDAEVPDELRESVLDLFRGTEQGANVMPLLDALPDTVALDSLIAYGLPLAVADKQALLAEPSRISRYRMLLPVLKTERSIAEEEKKIRAQYALSGDQRRRYLEEQKRQVQSELTELSGEGTEIDDLRAEVEKAELPDAARREAERELDRLGRMPPGSPEYGVAEDYVEWLVALPWHRSSEATVDLAAARDVLDRDHYDRDEVKERIMEYLSVRKLNPERQGALLCLVGAPGVGKTSLGRSVAEATDREFERIALGGIRDEAEVRGHRRTYIGALPGRLIRTLRQAGVNNPVIQLDEIDKLGVGFQGDPASALLEVLDPEQNESFVDNYLAVPFDLSNVMFMATANTISTIPPVLLDRLEVIELPGYSTSEKIAIARRFLVPKQLEAKGLADTRVDFAPEALELLVEEYTREAGVRSLERCIASLCRKMAREYIGGRCCYRLVDVPLVADLLGPPPYTRDQLEAAARPGTCATLVLSGDGGQVMVVEVLKANGTGRLIVTGRVGELLRESAELVFSFWKNRLRDDVAFGKHDYHIHFPHAATPKEGTGAGLPMALAFASSASGKPIAPRTAAVGEVTLHGRVLRATGMREKLAAAERAGVEQLLLPEANRAEALQAASKMDVAGMELIFVGTIDDALQRVLPTFRGTPEPATAGEGVE